MAENNEEHHGLVSVHECEDDQEADIIIQYLRAQGIEALRSSDMPHLILPVTSDAEILVNEDDAEVAKRLINERESAAPGTPDEPDEK